jgi:hypothetical protein
MSKQFDWDKHIIETSLKYDDHNPEHRKQLETYLTRKKSKPIETRRVALNKKPKVTPAVTSPLNIDIKFFDPIQFDEVLRPRTLERTKQKESRGLAKILGVSND